jgi:hypothetical protein
VEIRLPIGLFREARISVSRGFRARSLFVPSCPLVTLFDGPRTVTLVDLDQTNGNTTLLEQLVILGLAKQRGARTVFEFGTFNGRTAANLALTLGPEAEILTVDLPADQQPAQALAAGERKYVEKPVSGAKAQWLSNVTQLYGDTAMFDFSPWQGTRAGGHGAGAAAAEARRPGALARLRGLARRDRGADDLHRADPRFAGMKHVEGTSLCFLPLPGS